MYKGRPEANAVAAINSPRRVGRVPFGADGGLDTPVRTRRGPIRWQRLDRILIDQGVDVFLKARDALRISRRRRPDSQCCR